MNEFLIARHVNDAAAAFSLINEYIESSVYGSVYFNIEFLESLVKPLNDSMYEINKQLREGKND